MADTPEVARRTEVALNAIKSVFGTEIREAIGTEGDQYGATLFVSHHLEEIEEEYWLENLGKSKPEPRDVLSLLVLRSHWGHTDEGGIDIFDFTLPGDVTQYVLSVEFGENGEVTGISMES